MKRTILMSVFDSNMVRNMLRTDVLKTLIGSDDVERVVILVHPSKLIEYSSEFTSPKIVLEGYPDEKPSRAEVLAFYVSRNIIHTENVRLKINEILDHGNGSIAKRMLLYAVSLAVYYVSLISPIESLIRFFLIRAYDVHQMEPIIQKYKPDIVFVPTIFGNNDLRLLRYCQQSRIPTVGMVKSWDNLLGKDSLLMWPDRLIVHNEIVKEQAITMHSYPADRIYISGIPQYDVFADPTFIPVREVFFTQMGLDPSRKLILYSAMGSWISLYEKEIVELLADMVNKSNDIEYPSQLLVRLHPVYPSDDQKLRSIPGIRVTRPGSTGSGEPNRFDFEFKNDDTRELAATLRYADVIINSGSTMAIDAACFDTPIINVAFDGYADPQPYKRSARRLVDKQHYRPLLRSGGVRVARDRKELASDINMYLKDRSLDHEGRMRIVSEQCYKLDGKSGRRIGEYVIKCMEDFDTLNRIAAINI